MRTGLDFYIKLVFTALFILVLFNGFRSIQSDEPKNEVSIKKTAQIAPSQKGVQPKACCKVSFSRAKMLSEANASKAK